MTPSRVSWPLRLARLCLGLLGLLVAELGVRAWVAAGWGPAGGPAAALRDAAAEIAARAPELEEDAPVGGGRGRQVLHPFFGWGGERLDERIARDAESFRGDDGGRLDLVLTGGSVAVYFEWDYSEDLIERVNADPRFAGREVRILNLASGSLKQPQQLLRLAVVLNAGWRPEAVINLDGFNELALSTQNVVAGVEPFYPSFVQWGPLLGEAATGPEYLQGACEVLRERARAEALASRFERWGLGRSALVSQLAWTRMRSIRARHLAAQARFVAGLSSRAARVPGARGFAAEGDPLLDACAEVWAESSRSMHALCAARSIPYLHVLQPTLHDAGSKPLSDKERELDRSYGIQGRAVREGYPRLRAAGAVLRAEGIRFVDASRVFSDERSTLYRDSCHFSVAGNRLLGELVTSELLATLP